MVCNKFDSQIEALGVLKKHHLLGGIGEADLAKLVDGAQFLAFHNDQFVFHKGDNGDSIFGIISGSVRISLASSGGKVVTLNVLKRGQFFGEIALLDDQPRTADAISVGESILIRIMRNAFVQLLEENPSMAISIIRMLCDRLRWTTDIFEDSSFLTAKQRLAKRILVLVQTHGKPESEGTFINLRLSQEKIGEMVGLTRESTNQILSEWKADDILSQSNGYLTVIDPTILEAIGNA